jgi:siroheme synthase
MLSEDRSLESGLPELPYGSVWLVAAEDGDQRHLSPLAVHALSTADAVIHDPGISKALLGLVKPPRYSEAAAPRQAIERTIKLAEDGWRVVHLVEGSTVERAVDSAIRCAERNVLFRVVPNASEPIGGDAPLGVVLVHKTLLVGGVDSRPTLVLLIATPQSEAAARAERRQPPLGFSMSGLAG